ncbi:hypothetical protein P4129_30290 [Pseudomonas aeruginosa]|nr:hypothetical protein [Pseudomonas aeruginosa]
MSTFTASRVVDIDGVELTVRELSVADVRKLMQEVSDQDLVSNALFEDIRLSDLCLMTSVTESQINDLRPSQLAKLRDACKEVNPHFSECWAVSRNSATSLEEFGARHLRSGEAWASPRP